MDVVCDFPFRDEICGIQAIGRCLACGRPFCRTHRGKDDQCADCLAEAPDRAIEAMTASGQARKQALADFEQRRIRALTVLARHGNPGLTARRGPGTYQLTAWQKLAGRAGTYPEVDKEPAWVIGTYTWSYSLPKDDVIRFAEELTGYTPSGKLVQMRLNGREDNSGWPQEGAFISQRSLGLPYGPPGRAPSLLEVIEVLERHAATALRANGV